MRSNLNVLNSFIFFSILGIFISCHSATTNQQAEQNQPVQTAPAPLPVHHFDAHFATGEIMPRVPCLTDATKSYALYLPPDYDTSKSFPVIFFFDAHARGRLPLKLYKSLADKYHFIFAGSNDSQNGMDVAAAQQIASVFMNDLLQRVNINPKLIYVSGFSGGSKVACTVGFINTNVRGVIGCAAPFTEELGTVTNHPDVFLAAGNEDFNMAGMVQADEALNASGFTHQLYIFNGKHDWCDNSTFDLAMQWILIQAAKKGLTITEIKSPPDFNAWKKSVVVNEEVLKKEDNDEQALSKNFTGKDLVYWKSKIDSLEKSSIGANDKYLDARELNYVRMMGFVYSDGMLKQDNPGEAEHYLKLYELADPKNHDVYFLWAVLAAKSNNNALALTQLKKAAQLGFSDLNMLKSYSALNSIQQMNGYKEIYDEIVKNTEKE